jgi:precorrin-2/cobalt-factor-2 C20-methyltransferase
MPTVKDRKLIDAEHRKGAELLKTYLDRGENVVFLTLGDPSIYCTFSYIQHYLEADGYPVELVSGITSFCAAAARLNLPLAEWDEPIHIVPAVHKTEDRLEQDGNYVLMKSASHMKEVKALLLSSGRKVSAVVNCGMENEAVYRSAEEIPDDAGYFSLIIAKEK